MMKCWVLALKILTVKEEFSRNPVEFRYHQRYVSTAFLIHSPSQRAGDKCQRTAEVAVAAGGGHDVQVFERISSEE